MKGCAHVHCSYCDRYCNEYISSAKKSIRAFTLSSCLWDRPLLRINVKDIFYLFCTFFKNLGLLLYSWPRDSCHCRKVRAFDSGIYGERRDSYQAPTEAAQENWNAIEKS